LVVSVALCCYTTRFSSGGWTVVLSWSVSALESMADMLILHKHFINRYM
jgi:hypothetical protein